MTGLNRITITPASGEQWDRAWSACESATFYQSRWWAEVWAEYTRGAMQPDPHCIELEDGRSIILPLSARRRLKGLVREYHLSPGSTYGGWLSARPLDAEESNTLAKLVMDRFRNLIWRVNPHDASMAHLEVEAELAESTHVLDLAPGPDAIRRNMSKGHRAALNQAKRDGVCISTAVTLDEWREYYEVYRDSLLRWGGNASSRYEWPLFEAIHRQGSQHVRLWTAKCDGRIVAGAVCLSSSTNVAYWHGAALETYFNRRPVNRLLYEAIRDACERGLKRFDFNPSGRHDGVARFKKGFGARRMPCPVIRRQDAILKALKSWRHRIDARVVAGSPRGDSAECTGRAA